MSERKTIRIATRKSPLALWQANHAGKLLQSHWPDLTIELIPMSTSGDRFLKDRLLVAGGKGLFVKELEDALLSDRADIAVHSMKDVPADLPEGLGLTAICKRDNPMDAFISRPSLNLASLPQGSIIGTSSLRRQAQLLAFRPDLQVKCLRGNINTRLAKLDAGEFDAIILAAAGLERMGMQSFINEVLPQSIMLPACGQGAIGIECRVDDQALKKRLAPLNDEVTTLCVETERRVNARLGGNCHVPIAVYCTVSPPNQLSLQAKVFTPDGKTVLTDRRQGPGNQASDLADACAEALLAQGAQTILGLSP
ncbi:hydroxymethylbilane synthase [Legionella spiritensis]|uniref:Porphobilinogen deaminase n=1 Tax=Legionella spiritensis TaxID=452 RepID=A0A0W0Z609_LEGSP|nr:hydroxymethylbilane synthase [Legionella spiritensis]KTD64350.1 porphobilinogen deaminase [Legionella spiritensis]SNV46398.1 porphobilinogen deaminase [Legionella spiritensis]VEG91085.1 porphobilinogen deaminase [Legionella spiritensis]